MSRTAADRQQITVDVKHNPAKDRYEVLADGRLVGIATYRLEGDEVLFLHTAVEDAYRGQGLAHQLVGQALADVRAQGKRAVAVCPFVAEVMKRQAQQMAGGPGGRARQGHPEAPPGLR